jgi:hypothetical protein
MHLYRVERITAMAFEMSGKIVGPAPIDDFLNYLPRPSNQSLPESRDTDKKFTIVGEAGSEFAMYPLLVRVVNYQP